MTWTKEQIPRGRLAISFSRSGGPGGQNVNKVETRVEVRFHLATADWIPPGTRARLAAQKATLINQEGELIVSSSQHRSQAQNLDACLEKLAGFLTEASRRPRRRIATRPTRGSKERTLREKSRHSTRKQERRWRGSDD